MRDPDEPFFLLGSDRQGRDLLSRMIYASRLSLSIGFIGVATHYFLRTGVFKRVAGYVKAVDGVSTRG